MAWLSVGPGDPGDHALPGSRGPRAAPLAPSAQPHRRGPSSRRANTWWAGVGSAQVPGWAPSQGLLLHKPWSWGAAVVPTQHYRQPPAWAPGAALWLGPSGCCSWHPRQVGRKVPMQGLRPPWGSPLPKRQTTGFPLPRYTLGSLLCRIQISGSSFPMICT